jgi:hypothetical protein
MLLLSATSTIYDQKQEWRASNVWTYTENNNLFWTKDNFLPYHLRFVYYYSIFKKGHQREQRPRSKRGGTTEPKLADKRGTGTTVPRQVAGLTEIFLWQSYGRVTRPNAREKP